jgi:hypothetical protein
VPACDTLSLHEVSLYVVSLGKYCIWILRNFAKFENKKVTTKSLILMFLCQLKLRIKVDFKRFNLVKFRRVWQHSNSLVQIKNNRSVFVLRPLEYFLYFLYWYMYVCAQVMFMLVVYIVLFELLLFSMFLGIQCTVWYKFHFSQLNVKGNSTLFLRLFLRLFVTLHCFIYIYMYMNKLIKNKK